MGYHDLSTCTLTNDERVAEKDRITNRLSTIDDSQFTQSERRFINQITPENSVSVKQLFWLRDINEKY